MACRERVDVVVVVSSRAEVYVVEKVKDRWTGKRREIEKAPK